jgi:ATP-dependent helicase/nuclease subunit B
VPLTLVLGPANSAKAGEVLGAYTAARRRGALLVVPTALDAEHYARELADQGTVLGGVLTFGGLAREIAQRAGYLAAPLSPVQRRQIVKRIVGREKPPGYAIVAENLIAELERALVTPERFANALPRGEASELYRRYAAALDRIGRPDADLRAWRALDALRADAGRWGETPVFFYGFDDFSGIERDAIETLSRVVGVEVTASLTFEPGRTAFSARAEVVQELRALAERVVELPALDEHYDPTARRALHHLERHLFEPTGERIDPHRAVRLLEAGGERAEAELVADEVLRLLRDGVPPSEIVVVCRSLARSGPVLEHVFSRYGIALHNEYRLRFAHTALGRSVLALVRCSLLGLERAGARDLLDYLRTPGFLDRIELVDSLEAQAAREGLRTARAVRDRLDWRFAEFDTLRTAENLLAELGRHARRLFAAPHRGSAPMLGASEEREARALAALLLALDELHELGERPGVEELLELLEGLELRPARSLAFESVLLAEPLAIRARRFRAVFVCGLNESEFPLPGSSEPFLSDERRRELSITSGLRLARSEDALGRERYLFYACVSRATEQLVLSYRSSDEEGNLSLPSPFLADVAELFVAEWSERRRRRLLADVVWPADEAPTARERARSQAAAVELHPSEEDPSWTLGEAALGHVRHSEVVSAGALESYADCPVKWLVERELSPERLEPDPEPLARGSYMHSVLEEVVGRLDAAVTPESLPDALEILTDVLAEAPPTLYVGRPSGVRAGALQGIEADLRRYLAHEAADGSRWQPRGLELRFGFEEEERSLPALVLDGVRIRGVIDRVDVDGRKAIVRDYKSGGNRTEYPAARWQADRQLQVALYMIAVRELLGLEPVAGLYQPLGGRDLRARGAFLADQPVGVGLVATDARQPDELDELLRDAAERAVTLAARLRSGELTPCPETCSRNGCRYPGICRSS